MVMIFLSICGSAQTTIVASSGDGGFESGTTFAANGWTTVNSSTDAWALGNITSPGVDVGARSAFVSSTAGTTWAYSQISTVQHLYRDFTPTTAGETLALLSFKWKVGGEGTTSSDWDNMQVFLVPVTTTPVANIAIPVANRISGGAAVSGMYKLNSAQWNAETISFAVTPGTSYRVIFSWKSDATTLAQPPAALDSVNLQTVTPPSTYITSNQGGLWSSPTTWAFGVVPPANSDVEIPTGSVVTVDVAPSVKNMTISGTLQWGLGTFAYNQSGNMLINAGGKFLPFVGLAGQTCNIGGNFINNGYTNLAFSGSALIFSGTLFPNGFSPQLGGTGVFEGNGTAGIIRTLSFQTSGTSTITTIQNLITTNAFAHTAGPVNTNGKITIDNTAQVFGQPINSQVAAIAVTDMGAGYQVSPFISGAAATLWVAGATAVANTRYFSGNNLYVATAAGAFDASVAPNHTTGLASNGAASLLWIGTNGNIGNPFQVTAVTLGTQYFYGNNLYTCTVAGLPSASAPPVHTTGAVASGAATFLYVGNAAFVTANYSATTQTLRSFSLTSAGSGYASVPTISIIAASATAPTTAAAATAVYIPAIAGTASSTFSKTGGLALSGGLTINSTQGASQFSGVGAITLTTLGVNYTTAPTVGFAGPTAINLVTNPGSGYTVAPTITVTGGNLISGTALASSNFTITVSQGQIVSVYLNASTTAIYSTPPTLAFSAGSATLAFPAGCWPTATAAIGANGTISNFTITNPGFGYITAPSVNVGNLNSTANGGTFGSAASGLSCRIALYNASYGFFLPATSASANVEGSEIPANRRVNALTINGVPTADFSGSLELFSSSPLTLTSGNLRFGSNSLIFSNPFYAGASGIATSSVETGSIVLNTPGGSVTRTFNFFPSVSIATGSGSLATGSNVTSLTLNRTVAPTGLVSPTGAITGTRAYNLVSNVGGVYGASPTATLNYVSSDGIVGGNADVLIAQAAAVSGPWVVRSVSSGTGSLTLPGVRTTATSGVGPLVLTGNDFLGFATSFAGFVSAQTGTWSNGATWVGGQVPPTSTCADVIINTNHIVTVDAAGAAAKSVTINGSLVVSAGDLIVGCVDNNNTLLNTGALTVSGGVLSVRGNILNANGASFTQSAGVINIDGNSGVAATSVPINTDLFAFGTAATQFSTGTVSATGGTLNIINPHFSGTATSSGGAAFAFRGATLGRSFSSGHNTTFGPATKASTAAFGYMVDCYVNSALMMLGSVNVNGGAGSFAVQTNAISLGGGFNASGNITIAAGAELLDLTTAGQGVSLAGNLVNNGTFTQTNATGLRLGLMSGTTNTTLGSATAAQTVSGAGIFRNLASAATANFTAITINNPFGVSFSSTNVTMSRSLNIASPTVQVVPAGTSYTVGTAVGVTAPGLFTLNSDANLNQTGTNANTGNITVQRATSMKLLD